MHPERLTVDSVITPAQRAEAEDATAQCKRGVEDLWTGLARMVECNGWFALGYSSFRRWAASELDISLSNADKKLEKAKVLLALQQETGVPVAELVKGPVVRNANRARARMSPTAKSLRAAYRKLVVAPVLTTPDERLAAKDLIKELERLLA